MAPELENKLKNLPTVPGVYQYKDSKGKIIYVGKAKNLRNRVKSYFIDNLDPLSKTKALVDRIIDMSYIEVSSEFEALILEAELIKKYHPKYNISLKDDKSYLYIVIRNELGIPKIITERRPNLQKKDTVFGPYPDGSTAKSVVRTLRKIIPFRDCDTSKFSRYQKLKRPCLYGYIGLCSAPCQTETDLKKYKQDILKIKKLLSGNSNAVVKAITKEMKNASKNKDFEKAIAYRDTLNKFTYITQGFKTAQSYIDNPYLVEDIVEKSLAELKSSLPWKNLNLDRIECYDIANISGKEAVGAMVVATKGRIDKSEYRKFKIKLKSEPDDFGMIREVLERRLSTDWPKPNMIVVDGGKGQVSAALDVVTGIPVIGLAKRLETIVVPNAGEFTEIILARTNEGLKLLQRLRDEAHRFSQAYHHLLRMKKLSA